jgi:hypothetical protein
MRAFASRTLPSRLFSSLPRQFDKLQARGTWGAKCRCTARAKQPSQQRRHTLEVPHVDPRTRRRKSGLVDCCDSLPQLIDQVTLTASTMKSPVLTVVLLAATARAQSAPQFEVVVAENLPVTYEASNTEVAPPGVLIPRNGASQQPHSLPNCKSLIRYQTLSKSPPSRSRTLRPRTRHTCSS